MSRPHAAAPGPRSSLSGGALRAPRPAARGRFASAAAAVLSGLLFALAFPPREWVVLLPLALVPWLVALSREESRGRALLSGFLFGLAYWCASIPWIFYVVTRFGGQSGVMGVVCLVILARDPRGVARDRGAGERSQRRRPGSGRRLAAFPLLWMASEHARSFVYGGFPWNLTGHALYRAPDLDAERLALGRRTASGPLVVAVSSLLARVDRAARESAPRSAAMALVLAAGLAGAARLGSHAPAEPAGHGDLRRPPAAQRQPGGPAGAAATAEAYRTVLDQARQAARGPTRS